MNVLLWGVLPYVMMAILIGGLIWRYRYDQFGWTTRSSQLYNRGCYESALRCFTSESWS
jgi:nitrate reductase gamma subunit